MHQHAPAAPQEPLPATQNKNQGQKKFGPTSENLSMTSRKQRSLSNYTTASNLSSAETIMACLTTNAAATITVQSECVFRGGLWSFLVVVCSLSKGVKPSTSGVRRKSAGSVLPFGDI